MLTKSIKIRLLSDIHLEFKKWNQSFTKNADILILAGDIGYPSNPEYTNCLRQMSLLHSEVIVVTGNHEYYSKNTVDEIEASIKKICTELENVHFLQKSSVILNRIKFIGCTLWSNGTDKSIAKYINDFNYISSEKKDFGLDTHIGLHANHKKWLELELAKSKTDAYDSVCVVTHYLPSVRLIDKKFKDSPINMFFYSDVVTTGADFWCYGHTHMIGHNEFDGVKFHCNPRGYEHESLAWNEDFIFEINSK